MNFKDTVIKKLEMKNKNVVSPAEKGLVALARNREVSKKEQKALEKTGYAYWDKQKKSLVLTKRGKKALKNFL